MKSLMTIDKVEILSVFDRMSPYKLCNMQILNQRATLIAFVAHGGQGTVKVYNTIQLNIKPSPMIL